jgi:hypothetical protein
MRITSVAVADLQIALIAHALQAEQRPATHFIFCRNIPRGKEEHYYGSRRPKQQIRPQSSKE